MTDVLENQNCDEKWSEYILQPKGIISIQSGSFYNNIRHLKFSLHFFTVFGMGNQFSFIMMAGVDAALSNAAKNVSNCKIPVSAWQVALCNVCLQLKT